MGGMVVAQIPRRRQPASPWRLIVPLVIPFAILLAVALYATYKSHIARKTPPPGTPGSLVWGDAIFANRVQVQAWMKLHGTSYRVWAKHHPAALKLLPKPTKKPTAR